MGVRKFKNKRQRREQRKEKKRVSENPALPFNCKIPSLYTEFGAVIYGSQILAKIPPGNLKFPLVFYPNN
jgi:hypothetical protein